MTICSIRHPRALGARQAKKPSGKSPWETATKCFNKNRLGTNEFLRGVWWVSQKHMALQFGETWWIGSGYLQRQYADPTNIQWSRSPNATPMQPRVLKKRMLLLLQQYAYAELEVCRWIHRNNNKGLDKATLSRSVTFTKNIVRG